MASLEEAVELLNEIEQLEPLEPTFLEQIFAPRLVERIDLLWDLDFKTTKVIQRLNTIIEEKTETIEDQQNIIDVYLNQDLPKLQQDIKRYKELWSAAITVPDIRPHVINHKVYDPWTDGTGYEDYRFEKLADNEYYTYTQENWDNILAEVHPTVEKQLPAYIEEIADCDEFADAMRLAVKLAFIEAGKQRPPAFGGCLGRTVSGGSHAFCFYVLKTKQIIIYEPQSGETIGELGTLSKPYDPYYMEI